MGRVRDVGRPLLHLACLIGYTYHTTRSVRAVSALQPGRLPALRAAARVGCCAAGRSPQPESSFLRMMVLALPSMPSRHCPLARALDTSSSASRLNPAAS